MNWMVLPLKRYADFSGRSRRKEYWMFFLFYMLVAAVIGMLFFATADFSQGEASGGASALLIVAGLFVLALFVPALAVQVRRFHDQDRSGWLVLLGFIPYIGGIVVLVFMCLPGTVGPNRFGPDPKDDHLSDVFA